MAIINDIITEGVKDTTCIKRVTGYIIPKENVTVTIIFIIGIIIIGREPSTTARVRRARGRMVVSMRERSDSTPSRMSIWKSSIPVEPQVRGEGQLVLELTYSRRSET